MNNINVFDALFARLKELNDNVVALNGNVTETYRKVAAIESMLTAPTPSGTDDERNGKENDI